MFSSAKTPQMHNGAQGEMREYRILEWTLALNVTDSGLAHPSHTLHSEHQPELSCRGVVNNVDISPSREGRGETFEHHSKNHNSHSHVEGSQARQMLHAKSCQLTVGHGPPILPAHARRKRSWQGFFSQPLNSLHPWDRCNFAMRRCARRDV